MGLHFTYNGIDCYISTAEVMILSPEQLGYRILYEIEKI